MLDGGLLLTRPVVRLLFDRDVAVLCVRLRGSSSLGSAVGSAVGSSSSPSSISFSSSSSPAQGVRATPLLRARDAEGASAWVAPLHNTESESEWTWENRAELGAVRELAFLGAAGLHVLGLTLAFAPEDEGGTVNV